MISCLCTFKVYSRTSKGSRILKMLLSLYILIAGIAKVKGNIYWRNSTNEISLKVPKRENFSLEFFALSEPTWVCDLGPGKKIEYFIK